MTKYSVLYSLCIKCCHLLKEKITIHCRGNHELRGSASPVLTATGFVNGRGQFSTPTESTPLDRSPKNLLLVITSATSTAVPNLVQIRPRGASGQMDEM